MRAVHDFFYSKKLFKSLDYAAHGTTYEEGGVIVIEIELYSERAILLKSELKDITITLGKNYEYVSLALLQMKAEEYYELHITNPVQVVDELQKLDKQPWSYLDDLDYINGRKIRRKNSPVFLTDEMSGKARTLCLTYIANPSLERQLAPLFNTISRLISFTVTDKIAHELGYYSSELSGKQSPLCVTSKLFVSSNSTKQVHLERVEQIARKAIEYMLSSGLLERTVHDLRSIDYENDISLAPNIERMIAETGVLMGSKGWRSIVSMQNVTNVFDTTTLHIKFGRASQSVELREFSR